MHLWDFSVLDYGYYFHRVSDINILEGTVENSYVPEFFSPSSRGRKRSREEEENLAIIFSCYITLYPRMAQK